MSKVDEVKVNQKDEPMNETIYEELSQDEYKNTISTRDGHVPEIGDILKYVESNYRPWRGQLFRVFSTRNDKNKCIEVISPHGGNKLSFYPSRFIMHIKKNEKQEIPINSQSKKENIPIQKNTTKRSVPHWIVPKKKPKNPPAACEREELPFSLRDLDLNPTLLDIRRSLWN